MFTASAQKKDETEAFNLFRKAAEQGFPEAQYYLGDCYLNGRGVKEDEAKATLWLRYAAAQGEERAMILLRVIELRLR